MIVPIETPEEEILKELWDEVFKACNAALRAEIERAEHEKRTSNAGKG